MKKENHMPRDSNSLLRKQIRTAAKIFEWIDHITESENDAVQDIFFEDDKPLMCLYCGMKRKSFRIYTEINTANDSISVSISFPVSCNDENMPRVTKCINKINSELLFGYFRLDNKENAVKFCHSYPFVDKIDVALFKEMFVKYLVTADVNSTRIIRVVNYG